MIEINKKRKIKIEIIYQFKHIFEYIIIILNNIFIFKLKNESKKKNINKIQEKRV